MNNPLALTLLAAASLFAPAGVPGYENSTWSALGDAGG